MEIFVTSYHVMSEQNKQLSIKVLKKEKVKIRINQLTKIELILVKEKPKKDKHLYIKIQEKVEIF